MQGITIHVTDKKLKADIAEYTVLTKLLKKGFAVLKPVGDRLPYDLVIESAGRFLKVQIKSAWLRKGLYSVDSRRTKTNRRNMRKALYCEADFDFAIVYLEDLDVCYVLPVQVFCSYKSGIGFIEAAKRQRKPRSHRYREAWHLLAS